MAGRLIDRLQTLSVIDISELSILLDEFLTGFDLITHEKRECLIGSLSIIKSNAEELTGKRVHCSIPELLGAHLAETLESLDKRILPLVFSFDLLNLLLVISIICFVALIYLIERRAGDIDISAVNERS